MPENVGQSIPQGMAGRSDYRHDAIMSAIDNGAGVDCSFSMRHPDGSTEFITITEQDIELHRRILVDRNMGRFAQPLAPEVMPESEQSSLPTPLTQAVTFDYARYLNPSDIVHLTVDTAGASVSPELYAHAIRDAAQRRFVERQHGRIRPEVGNAPISDWAAPVGDAPDRMVFARVAPHVAGSLINWGEIAPTNQPDEPQAVDDWRGDACEERRPIQRERLAAHDSRDRMRERTGEERVRAYALANRLKDGNIE